MFKSLFLILTGFQPCACKHRPSRIVIILCKWTFRYQHFIQLKSTSPSILGGKKKIQGKAYIIPFVVLIILACFKITKSSFHLLLCCSAQIEMKDFIFAFVIPGISRTCLDEKSYAACN